MDEKYLKYKQKYFQTLKNLGKQTKIAAETQSKKLGYALSKAVGQDSTFDVIYKQIDDYKKKINEEFKTVSVVTINELKNKITDLETELTKYNTVLNNIDESAQLLKVAIEEYFRRMTKNDSLGRGITTQEFDEVLQGALLIDFKITDISDKFAKYDSGELLEYTKKIIDEEIANTKKEIPDGITNPTEVKIDDIKKTLKDRKDEIEKDTKTLSENIKKLENIKSRLVYLKPSLENIQRRTTLGDDIKNIIEVFVKDKLSPLI